MTKPLVGMGQREYSQFSQEVSFVLALEMINLRKEIARVRKNISPTSHKISPLLNTSNNFLKYSNTSSLLLLYTNVSSKHPTLKLPKSCSQDLIRQPHESV